MVLVNGDCCCFSPLPPPAALPLTPAAPTPACPVPPFALVLVVGVGGDGPVEPPPPRPLPRACAPLAPTTPTPAPFSPTPAPFLLSPYPCPGGCGDCPLPGLFCWFNLLLLIWDVPLPSAPLTLLGRLDLPLPAHLPTCPLCPGRWW